MLRTTDIDDEPQPQFQAEAPGLLSFYCRRRIVALLTIPIFAYFMLLVGIHFLFGLLTLYWNFGKIFIGEDYWAWLGVLWVASPGLIPWYTLKYLQHIWENLKNTRGQKILMSFGLLAVTSFGYNIAFTLTNPFQREPIKHAVLSPILLATGHRGLAWSEFKAIWTEKLDLAAHRALGSHYLTQQKWDLAAKEFERAVEIEPNSAETHWMLGLAYHSAERKDDALREYRRSLELDPSQFQAHTAIGNVFFESEDYDRALEAYRRAIDTFPPGKKTTVGFAGYTEEVTLARYYLAVAQVHMKMEAWSEAITALERAKQIDADPDVFLALGQAYEEIGRNQDALDAFGKFVSLAGNDPSRKDAVDFAQLEIEVLKTIESKE